MREVRVLTEFVDKTNRKRRFAIGEILMFDEGRAQDVVSRGLAEYVAPVKPLAARRAKKSKR